MENIEQLIKARCAKAKENQIYHLLGLFGDRLSDSVKTELRAEADYLSKIHSRYVGMVKKSI